MSLTLQMLNAVLFSYQMFGSKIIFLALKFAYWISALRTCNLRLKRTTAIRFVMFSQENGAQPSEIYRSNKFTLKELLLEIQA